MTIGNQHLTKQITVRYYIALALVALVVTASYVVQSRALDAERAPFRVIALVKEQRGEIEQATGLANLLVAAHVDDRKREEHRKALRLCLRNIARRHEILSLRDGPQWIPAGMSRILHHAYFSNPDHFDRRMATYLRDAKSLLKIPNREPDGGLTTVEKLNALTPVILSEHRSISRKLREVTRSNLERLRKWMTLLWLLTLTILAVEVPLIFRPMKREAASTLEKLDSARLKAQSDAALAQAAREGQAGFIRNMSHELRTPLNGILGMAQLLRMRRLPPKEDEYVSDIQQAGEGLLELINSILEFSRLEAGQVDIQIDDCRLKDTVGHTVSLLRPLAEEKSLELTWKWDSRLAELYRADRARIRQVLLNLVGNAIKFTHKGSIEVRARYMRREGAHTDWVRIEVQDSGVGVPEDKQEIIFNEFQQAEAGLSRRYEGTGLGLAICQRLITLMDGEMGLHSTWGVGSTFWFMLPLERVRVPETACSGGRCRVW